MKAVFVDFEMNPIGRDQKEARRICKGEIIEIGAVKIDEDGNEISSYKEYVLPEYTTAMNQTCQELTGITMEMLAGKPHFRQAFDHFLTWCNEGCPNAYEMFAWSENDWRQLDCELRLKEIDEHDDRVRWMLDHWQNFQQIYCNLLGLDNVISLDKAPWEKPSTARCTTPSGMPATRPNSTSYRRKKKNSAISCSLSSTPPSRQNR